MTHKEAFREVILDLVEQFSDHDDRDDAPFGEYPRVTVHADTVLVLHESEPWGVSIKVELHDS